jgi:flavorubredoxin
MKVVSLYDQWSKHHAEVGVVIVFASMYGNTEQIAEEIARKTAEQGVKHIRVFDVSKTHVSYILRDIWKYRGVVLGSCAYNSGMHPMMQHLCNELEMIAPKNKVYGLFGSCSWSGGGVKTLQAFASATGWEEAAPSIEFSGSPTFEKLTPCDALAQTLAATMKK